MNAGTRSFLERLPGAADVKLARTRQRRDHRPPDFGADGPDRLEVALRSDGEPGLQSVHPQAVELAGHFQLLSQGHAATRRLLSVAQRGVKNENLLGHLPSPSSEFRNDPGGRAERWQHNTTEWWWVQPVGRCVSVRQRVTPAGRRTSVYTDPCRGYRRGTHVRKVHRESAQGHLL